MNGLSFGFAQDKLATRDAMKYNSWYYKKQIYLNATTINKKAPGLNGAWLLVES